MDRPTSSPAWKYSSVDGPGFSSTLFISAYLDILFVRNQGSIFGNNNMNVKYKIHLIYSTLFITT